MGRRISLARRNTESMFSRWIPINPPQTEVQKAEYPGQVSGLTGGRQKGGLTKTGEALLPGGCEWGRHLHHGVGQHCWAEGNRVAVG